MTLRALLRAQDLAATDLALLLRRTRAIKSDPLDVVPILRGASVLLYFEKPSTRTRLAFETAVHRLGGAPIKVGPSDLQIGRGETIEDTARVVSRYARAFIARTFSDELLATFADAATIPVVNALTDLHHPTQAVADLFTLEERFGDLARVKLAYVGDGNNVCHSLIEGVALAGATLRVATPSTLAPKADVVAAARTIARRTGATVDIGTDPDHACDGVDAVYTDTWQSMGDKESERSARLELLAPYRVDAARMGRAKPSAVFLHCLPAHRGEEVTAEVADGAQSIIFDQAENKLHAAVAILEAVVGGALGGHALP